MAYINILFVNMCHRNAVTHSLLNTNKDADIIMVQEPWYDKIGSTHSDSDPEGVDKLGRVANPKWDCIYPKTEQGERCKVMAYCRISLTHFNTTNHLDISPCHHILTLDIHLGSNPQSMTIVSSDFNTHAQAWSPPGICHSPWADDLEDWAVEQNLELASP
jgi:hypothetical protein